MRSLKYFVVLALSVLVGGCAGMVKPEMDEATYWSVASGAGLLEKCSTGGHLTPDETATGQIILRNRVSQYRVDQPRLLQMIRDYPLEASTEGCRKLAVQIHMYKQNQASQPQTQAPQPTYRAPARTICNNIAGQMLCSTY